MVLTLPKSARILPTFHQQSRGKRSEREVSFLHADPRLAEGYEGVGARVGIDDRLEADFGLVKFQRACWDNIIVAGGADEVADQADVGLSSLALPVAPPKVAVARCRLPAFAGPEMLLRGSQRRNCRQPLLARHAPKLARRGSRGRYRRT